MNSCLYECDIVHHRLSPKQHRFGYKVFMFYLDLDEIDFVAKSRWLVGHNRFNIFNFKEDDHLNFGGRTVKDSVAAYLTKQGVMRPLGRVMLLTHLRTFGYIFNPVSFYFCYDKDAQPLCVVAEVGNTFREMKPFFLGPDCMQGEEFNLRIDKNFYVSPFIDLDTSFDFRLRLPKDRLILHIDDYQEGKKIFLSSVVGERKMLTDATLLWYTVRFPLITLKIIAAIHWQALRLYLKKIRFIRKSDHPELQQEVFRAKSNS